MNKNQILIILGILLTCGSGCGMMKMPDKMDQSNANMDDMKSSMGTTNDGVKQSNANMKITNDVIHKQTLMVALDHMFSPDNTKYLYPVPAGMMPFAKAFAEEMHEDEFAQFVFNYMKDINEVGPDDSEKVSGKWPDDLLKKVNHDKQVKYNAIQAVSGFAPQELIEKMVGIEYTDGGEYSDTAFIILQARASFISDILLEQTLFSKPLDDPGKLKKSTEFADYLQYIQDLPFASSIGVKTYGFLNNSSSPDDDNNFQIKLDPKIAKNAWQKINRAFDDDLLPKYKDEMNSGKTKCGASLRSLREKVQSHLK